MVEDVDPKRKAKDDIIRVLGFTDDQLNLVGRCLSLEEDSKLVQYVKVEYTQTHLHGVPIIELGESRQICVDVALQPSQKRNSHENIMGRIGRALQRRGVDAKDLFSYGQKSYGLEREDINVDISLGFKHPAKPKT